MVLRRVPEAQVKAATVETQIRDRLAALAPEALELLDESALHVGHCRMLPETRVRASDTDIAVSGK